MSTQKKPWFLSNDRKERSEFWKSRGSSFSTSNYWLKDSIFEKKESSFFDDDPTLERSTKYDHMQLAQYQRAISNFVRILTGRGDLIVKYNFGGESYTDGKTITLSPSIKEKEFDTAVGLALHEASHIIYTDFAKWKRYMDDVRTEYAASPDYYDVTIRRKEILNIVEDVYIDAMTYRSAPGYRGYYASLYQKYFGSEKLEEGLWSRDYAEPTWDNYMFHVCNIRNPRRNLNALPGLEEIFNLLDLPNITRLSKFNDRVKLSRKIYDVIEKYATAASEFKQHLKNQFGEFSEGDGECSNGGNSQEEMTQALNDMLEQMADQEEADGGAGEADESVEVGDADGDGGKAGTTGKNKFTASNGIAIQEELESSNALDLDKLSDKAKTQLEKLIRSQREFIDGNTHKGRLNGSDQKKIDAWSKVDMEKKTVGSNSEFSKRGIPLYIIDNITNGFIDSVGSNYGFRSYNDKFKERNIEEGINRGKLLAKKLQLRNEERVLKTSRLDSGKIDKRLLHEIGFDNFDIFQKVNISSYKPSFIHISIDQSGSMDGSKFESAMKLAAMFATASKYIKNIHLVISVRSTTVGSVSGYCYNTNSYKSEDTPYLVYIFDSKKNNIQHIRNIFPKIHAFGYTPEGLCFDGIMKDTIKKSANTDAHFINICDGEPYLKYSNTNGSFEYVGNRAKEHSKRQMQSMERNGINFITYFIGNIHEFGHVEQCYGKNAVHLRYADEIMRIAKTLNRKLLAT